MNRIAELRKVVDSWWFGHVVLFVMGVSIIGVAALMEPSTQMLHLFGEEVPVMCGWRRVTGWPCLGCGLTRSFVFMAHGRVLDGFDMNLMGPPFFTFLAVLTPVQLVRLAQGWWKRRG